MYHKALYTHPINLVLLLEIIYKVVDMQSSWRFLTIVAALAGISVFATFCLTVRSLPSGKSKILIEGPWNTRIESSFGCSE